uniref:alcohol dehydrogenase catalytic domain-containing protein n=2 Tax=Pseudomonadota TaxID=1224 RepID=UPI0020C412E4
MEVVAAVARTAGGEFTIEHLTLGDIRPDEILVRVVATGLCHTDIVVRDQLLPTPLPVVLGHEGAGIVEAIGAEVASVAPGDRVVMGFAA